MIRDAGLVLAVPAGLAVTGLAVAVANGEGAAAAGFAAAAVVGGAAGGGLMVRRDGRPDVLAGRRAKAHPTLALAWLFAAALAAVPFWFAGALGGASPSVAAHGDPLNALFESMSGLTSTGLSVASDSSELPRSIQWWRSVLQWVGALGVLYVALALADEPDDGSEKDRLEPEMDVDESGGVRGIRPVWALYGAFTAATAVAFWAAGMPPWAAVNHAMTAMATGGFAITGDSLASYGRAVHAVAAVALVLGALSFGLHLAVFVRGRLGAAVRDGQTRLLGALLVGGLAALALATRGGDVPLADAAFQWTSALTTAGFTTQDVAEYGPFALAALIAAMFVGGASGSTAGGLKLDRARALLRWAAGRRTPLARPALRQAGRLAVALGAGTAVLVAFAGVPPLDALFEATSALGTVGLSVGVSSADLAAPGRLALVALMWVGRLEVVAVVALFLRHQPSR